MATRRAGRRGAAGSGVDSMTSGERFVTAYGEDHPRPVDDRLPMVLVILDGLGDRAHLELALAEIPRTASEAASTPILDELARRGQCGVHVPLGWGRAPASEIAHWSLFGFADVPFPGRARLEALGHGLSPTEGTLQCFAALRPSQTDSDGRIWITGRARRDEPEVARALMERVQHFETSGFRFELAIFDRGEAILTISAQAPGRVAALSDTDPFFEHLHPMLAPVALADSSEPASSKATALALAEYLRWARATLADDPRNEERVAHGLPALDTITTKWASLIEPVPQFVDVVGVRGAMVSTSPFYRGLGRLLGMDHIDATPGPHVLADSLGAAVELYRRGAQFIHVHTKVTDEAGHTKSPSKKREAVEWCDTQLARLLEPPFSEWAIAVTGDHATPASGGVLHTGDPTPFVIVAPTARPDAVTAFGESSCRSGELGVLAATDVLPLLCSHANRPRFLGHRSSRWPSMALPDDPIPFV